jgi:hypothetical protein
MAGRRAAGSPMEGKGAYNANSDLQALGASLALPLLSNSASALERVPRSPKAMADG